MLIKTFVFFDIETTGLPNLEFNRTKITECAFVACTKVEMQEHVKKKMPRVVHKLTFCVNPRKMIHPDSSKITGLDNYQLENEKFFSKETGELVKCFFNQLQAPLCLVAHNGLEFDYPILRKQLDEVGVSLDDVLCVDSLNIFKEIESELTNTSSIEECDRSLAKAMEVTAKLSDFETLLNCDIRKQQEINERTPSARLIKSQQSAMRLQAMSNIGGIRVGSKSKRELFPFNDKKDGSTPPKRRISFKLVDIYTRLHGVEPTVAHNAEEDAVNLMKCALAVCPQFIELTERSAVNLASIPPLGTK